MAHLTTSGHSRRTASLRAAMLLVAAWFVYFARQLLSSGVPFRRDALFVHLPARQFIREQLLSGSLPQWYPYEGVGVPFIGQIVTATFHPQTLLFLWLSPAQAQKWSILAAYLYGLIGGYRLARAYGASRLGAWMGGAALAFGGYALSMSDNLPYLVSLCTLPWVAWAARHLTQRRRLGDIALLGILWALIFLGGDAQMFGFAPILMLPAILLAEDGTRGRSIGLMCGSAGLALLLCGAELLPALAAYSESARLEHQFVIDVGRHWALHPWRLLELVTPGFLPAGDRIRIAQLFGDNFLWAASMFAGGIVMWLALAGVSRRARAAWAFAAVALFAVLMAMGTRAGLYTVVTTLAPPVGLFRFPEKYMALFWCALAPLVAFGWDAATAMPRRWTIAALVIAGLLLIVATLPLPSEAWRPGLATTAAFLGLSGACLRLSRARWLVPVLLFAELWHGNAAYLPIVAPGWLDADAYPNAQRAKEDRSRGLAPPRVLSMKGARPVITDSQEEADEWVRESMQLLRPDSAGLAHVDVLGLAALPAYGARPRALFGPKAINAPLVAGLLNGCSETQPMDGEVQLAPLPCRPRAYFAALRPAANVSAALAQVTAGLGDNDAVWEGNRAIPLETGTIEWESWRPGAFRLRVTTTKEAGLVVSEGIARGWTAMLDGASIPLTPANVAVMAFVIPPGQHELSAEFHTPNLRLGLAMSAVGLLLSLMLLRRSRVSAG